MILERGSSQSNLERFLDCTAPVVPSQFLPKSEIRSLNRLWHPVEKEKIEYFNLADLWNCYDEWSAYGAGVPINLGNKETLIQYYVPYLSAIQIFTSKLPLNCLREEADSLETRDSFSDSLGDESEGEKLLKGDAYSCEEGVFEQENLSYLNDKLGCLYFQYFERFPPYGRVPLMDKVSGLTQRYPGLFSLGSVDLSPASWMSVSWYPIYHIPMGRTIKDLETCFLTYHNLSSSFQDMDHDEDDQMGNVESKLKKVEGISLPPFGLATYKMQGNVWMSDKRGQDQEKVVSLFSIADSWLKQLKVQHHDFSYFLGIRHG